MMPLGRKKVFQNHKELTVSVDKYCNNKFEDVESFATTYGYPINNWDVSLIKDFSDVFYRQRSFNENISNWNVSNATDMRWMFDNAEEFNQDLSSWNVSKVTDMESM